MVLPLDEGDQRVATSLQLHRCAGFDEPVKPATNHNIVEETLLLLSLSQKEEKVLFLPELRSIPNSCSQLLVDIFLVEAQLVKHANQEPVFLFGVVLALVCAVVDAKLDGENNY